MSALNISPNSIPLTSTQQNQTAPVSSRNQAATRFQEVLAAAVGQRSQVPVQTAPQPASGDNRYAVQEGDTLSEIVAAQSRRLGINHSPRDLYTMVDQIAARNHLADPDFLLPGQKLDLSGLSQTSPETKAASIPVPVISSNMEVPTQTTGLQSPLTGKITSLFGMRTHPILGETLHHDGIDISRPAGTPVKPLSSGVVTFAGNNGGYGQMVEITHENGLTSRYAHLSTLSVHEGEQVSPEQLIGEVGQTGLATGPHLHLEILRRGIPIDPLTLLARSDIEPGLLVAEAQGVYRR